MKEADWKIEKYATSSNYTSKYLTINHGTDITMKVNFVLSVEEKMRFQKISRKE